MHIVDLFPTFAGLAGFPIDAQHQPRPLDGLDVLPVLTQGAKSPHEEILLGCETWRAALRVGDWKIVVQTGEQRPNAAARARQDAKTTIELFNLKTDPGEKEDLAEQEPAKLAEMQARLARYQQEAIPPRSDPTGKVGAKE